MTQRIPYAADHDSLYYPCKNARFFQSGRPTSEAWLCAELSRLVYCGFEDSTAMRSKVEATLDAAGFGRCDFFSKRDTQGFFTRNKDLAILVFRGTEQLKNDPLDYLIDAELTQVTLPGNRGKIHYGFHEALMWAYDSLRPILAAVNAPRLIFTGHSLGAALATYATSIWRPTALYTFGSPRVGDGDFKNYLESRDVDIRRYVDCCDIVTQVPPERSLFRDQYKHVGRLFYIDRHGEVRVGPSSSFVAKDQRDAHIGYIGKYSLATGNVKIRSLADHAPLNYVSAFTGRTCE